MKILCKSNSNYGKVDTPALVNKIGQYLYNNIDNRVKMTRKSNTCDVYVNFYYMLPKEVRDMVKRYRAEFSDDPDVTKEVLVDISITTYQNKIRINVLEMLTPAEVEHRRKAGEQIGPSRTLGFKVFPPDKLTDFNWFKSLVVDYVIKSIKKYYTKYEVYFMYKGEFK